MVRPEREISSGGVIIKKYGDNIRILLIKDPFGKWTWPKGKIDKGETALDAAIREIGEETGLNNIEHISRVGQVNYYYRRHRLIYKTVHLYLFKFFGKETLSIKKDEIDDGKWFSDKEALSIVEYDGAKKLLSKAIKIYRKRAENRNGG
ncbi:MAG: NUDIX domain-containing protein [Candidatus Omnitrophica bacterium]|nr:NUDIX domain-containing protein [Candidatus Omnitrophota bacterium]